MQELVEDIIVNTYPPGFVPKFSMVMPVHNEGGSIEQVVMDVYNELGKKLLFEIILSEDGSKDNTKEVILSLSKKIPLKAILSYQKRGYSGGIKEGLKHVSAPFVLVSDSDGQHKASDFWKLKNKFEEVGFRRNIIISGNRITRADSQHRKIMSKVFQKISSFVFDLPPIKDITSAFKLMDANLAREIADECKYMKESFWTEFIIRACNRDTRIIEIPVEHIERAFGETVVYKKSKIPKIVISQLKSIIKLKKELSRKTFLQAILETKVFRQLFSFALVGSSGAGIILLLTWLLTTVGLNYILSAAIGIETSIFWAFTLNNKITFKEYRKGQRLSHRFLKYQGIAFSALGLNLLILYLLTNSGLFYLLSEIISISIVFLYNFTLSRKIVWIRKTKFNSM